MLRPEDLTRKRGKGRPSEALARDLLIAGLFRAWMVVFQEYPKINNKNYPLSPFVRFATAILTREGIGKIEDHLEEFRVYQKKVHDRFWVSGSPWGSDLTGGYKTVYSNQNH